MVFLVYNVVCVKNWFYREYELGVEVIWGLGSIFVEWELGGI